MWGHGRAEGPGDRIVSWPAQPAFDSPFNHRSVEKRNRQRGFLPRMDQPKRMQLGLRGRRDLEWSEWPTWLLRLWCGPIGFTQRCRVLCVRSIQVSTENRRVGI